MEAPDPHAQNGGDIEFGFQGTRMEATMDKYKHAPMMMLLCKISEENERQEKEKKERKKHRTRP